MDQLTYFDLAVFSILLISALLSFFRGFVREMLSLGAWVGAGILTLYLFPHVAALFGGHIHNKTIASGFATLLTFALSLLAITLVSNTLLKFVKSGSDVGLLDHGMGLLFGLARGSLVLAVGFFIYSQLFTTKDAEPDWIKHAVTRPYVARASHVVARLAPSYLDELVGTKKAESKAAPEDDDEEEVATPDKDVAADVKQDMSSDWPTVDDLKQRMKNVTKE